MSTMYWWLKSQGLSYSALAGLLGQTSVNISNKVRGKTTWQQKDLIALHQLFGLSSDFVLGISDIPLSKPLQPA